MSKLLSPRGGGGGLDDLGERSSFVSAQRVGRARRRRARSRTLRLPVLIAVLVLALLAAGAIATIRWLSTSPWFAITSVDVRGTMRVSAERIAEAADVPVGISLFRVDPAAIAARVEALPEIRRADVIRELPNRVAILVEERRPFTLAHAERLVWVDEDARVVGEERQAVVPAVPLITGLTEEEIGGMRAAPNGKARAGIALIQILLRSGSALVSEIAEIDVGGRGGPVLHTMDGVEVRLGTEDWNDRLARLEGVLGQIAKDDARVSLVDLRFRDQVVLRRGGQL